MSVAIFGFCVSFEGELKTRAKHVSAIHARSAIMNEEVSAGRRKFPKGAHQKERRHLVKTNTEPLEKKKQTTARLAEPGERQRLPQERGRVERF